MATTLKLRRGTTAQHATFTGAAGEVTVDTDKEVVVVHDGATAGGFPAVRAGGTVTASAGTVSAPAITTTGDTNTGIFFPAADTIAFSEGGVERMRLDSAGNLGVGTATPTQELTVYRDLNGGAVILVDNPNAGTSANAALILSPESGAVNFVANSSTSTSAAITGGALGAGLYTSSALSNGLSVGTTAGPVKFFAGSTTAERMRINDAGNVGIGTTSPNDELTVVAPVGAVVVSATGATDSIFRAVSSPTGTSYFAMGDTDDVFVGGLEYTNSDNALRIWANNAERMRINASGNVGIATTVPQGLLHVVGGGAVASGIFASSGADTTNLSGTPPLLNVLYGSSLRSWAPATETEFLLERGGNVGLTLAVDASGLCSINFGDPDDEDVGEILYAHSDNSMRFITNAAERARITSTGDFLVATTSEDQPGLSNNTVAIALNSNGQFFASSASQPGFFNRTADGAIMTFQSAGTAEGNISIAGSTTSYNGGHLSRWAQMLTKPDLLKGTVMSNLDDMNVYIDADGNTVQNEQLNKVKVSDVEGDANVAGVFVNWTHDDAHNVDEINMAMTGDMIIRIAQGVTVQRGDLLMSAGDGTAKPQGDDIVRSKTIAKVTSTHVTCTYEDGSYCVPCVLMAC
jgi:hypothetical protein